MVIFSGMPELLFELGCEELPASAVERAFSQLADEIIRRLEECGLSTGEVRRMGTPRRLIIGISDVQDRQPDSTKDFRGPGIAAAFDAEGNPTKALEGFCRGKGVDVREVRREGDYVWVTKTLLGKPTGELLAQILPDAVRSLTFDKTMRWGAARMRFARPIRWILATFGGELVPFEIEGVQSGLASRGHRFNAPATFVAKTFDDLVAGLRERSVEPDHERRRTRIVELAGAVASGTPDLTEALVDENVFLTEWPTAIEGEFKAEFMALPDAVLITAMAKHERFFPVRDGSGKLTNRFVSIRNGGVDDVVRAGNAWVLNARFNDAKFFFDEDKEKSLDDFLAMTDRMLFQEKLGTVRQRADRLAELAALVAQQMGSSADEVEWARQAGLYAKADLTTGLVSELASLQGVIGGEYARREGFPEPVCHAIACQYDADKATSNIDHALIVADQIDKLVGYLGIGLEPSGSSDPFGLRRAVTILIEGAWRRTGHRLSGYYGLIEPATSFYGGLLPADAAKDVTERLVRIFRSRYEAMLDGEPYDCVNAAITTPDAAVILNPQVVLYRLATMKRIKDDVSAVQTASRPLNILDAAITKGQYSAIEGLDVDRGRLSSDEGYKLLDTLIHVGPRLDSAEEALAADQALQVLLDLKQPIHEFFEKTMVMAEDPDTRRARLSLVDMTCRQLERIGNFRELVIE
ncbi:MAG: Glycine--tRNA ligase beta subunit [Fimbriimonadaceae bacterium]|nr:Glycine--tRNA ligase beta subunit [Fimbriimonadaceae bacterium]